MKCLRWFHHNLLCGKLSTRPAWSLNRLKRPLSPKCFSPHRYLCKPLWLLPTEAITVRWDSHPPGKRAFPRRTQKFNVHPPVKCNFFRPEVKSILISDTIKLGGEAFSLASFYLTGQHNISLDSINEPGMRRM